MGYIYKITNTINNKIYIGKTVNTIEYRWHQHVREAHNKKNTNILLHNAINKYGYNKFTIEVLEQCDNEMLNEKEKLYIYLYDSFYKKGKGYNMTQGGDGGCKYNDKEILELWNQGLNIKQIAQQLKARPQTIGIHLRNYISHEEIKKRQDNLNKKAVEQYTLDGKFLYTWDSATDAARELGLAGGSHISGCCRHKEFSASGFLWKYVEDDTPIEFLVNDYLLSHNCKDVYEITKDGEIIKWYESPKAAELDLGISTGKVSYICKFKIGTHSALGHYFMWANPKKRKLLGVDLNK